MNPFQAPVDDILFSLKHVAGTKEQPDNDRDLRAEIARHIASFGEGDLAPLPRYVYH